jgi:hypothetical protein
MANKSYLGMRGKSLNWAISTIAGCDFLLFGYGKLEIDSVVSKGVHVR